MVLMVYLVGGVESERAKNWKWIKNWNDIRDLVFSVMYLLGRIENSFVWLRKK